MPHDSISTDDVSAELLYVVACSRGDFRCVAGGLCVPSEQRCNGRCDCPHCTDELNCSTPRSYVNSTTTSSALQSSQFTSTREPLFSDSKCVSFYLCKFKLQLTNRVGLSERRWFIECDISVYVSVCSGYLRCKLNVTVSLHAAAFT